MEIRHFWLRDERRNPVACVAIKLVDSGINYALAIPNPLDRFDKARGREIAVARVEKGRVGFIYNPSRLKRSVMLAIAGEKALPSRVRRAARGWLERDDLLAATT